MIAVGAILFVLLIVAWLVAPSEPELEAKATKTDHQLDPEPTVA